MQPQFAQVRIGQLTERPVIPAPGLLKRRLCRHEGTDTARGRKSSLSPRSGAGVST